jgi:hypothetical protein
MVFPTILNLTRAAVFGLAGLVVRGLMFAAVAWVWLTVVHWLLGTWGSWH